APPRGARGPADPGAPRAGAGRRPGRQRGQRHARTERLNPMTDDEKPARDADRPSRRTPSGGQTSGGSTSGRAGRPSPAGDGPARADEGPGDKPDMTRERARTERRDLDKERGEPVAGGAARGGPRALRSSARPLHDWTTRPRI